MTPISKPKRLLQSVVSLTNSQVLASKVFSTHTLLPDIFLPRLAYGANLSLEEADEILKNIPSLDSEVWTRYWIKVGNAFEARENFQAACMCYIMGSFPKEDAPWKNEINELKKKSFKEWNNKFKAQFEERTIQTPQGKIRYYLSRTQKITGRTPLVLLLNGLEGSCEEFAFPLYKYLNAETSYALLSIPGSSDYEVPMTSDSDQLIRYVIDDICQLPWVDQNKVGMVGFSFGAYWTFICAKTDPRIKFSLINGIPLRRTFSVAAGLKLNPIISYALLCMFNLKHPVQLARIVRKMRLRGEKLIQSSSGPLLAMNGDHDSIVDPLDTADLSQNKSHRIVWFKNDDHLGLFHYYRMVSMIVAWIQKCLKDLEKS